MNLTLNVSLLLGKLNLVNRNEGHDILVGGAQSIDTISADDGNDFAAGDCVSIEFFADHHISSILSTSEDIGKNDFIRMGNGDDFAIGGTGHPTEGGDFIHGGHGNDLLVGDSCEMLFFTTELNATGEAGSPGYFCKYRKPDTLFQCDDMHLSFVFRTLLRPRESS